MKDGDKFFRIRKGFILRKVFDEYLVIPVTVSGDYESYISILNPVAEFIWRMLEQGGASFSQLLEAVLEEFNVDEETASVDIYDFLRELREKQYLIEDTEDGYE